MMNIRIPRLRYYTYTTLFTLNFILIELFGKIGACNSKHWDRDLEARNMKIVTISSTDNNSKYIHLIFNWF